MDASLLEVATRGVKYSALMAAGLLALACAAPALGQASRAQQSELILQPGGDVAEHDTFGTGAAVSGNTMVIGAENADGNQVGAGAAFVFEKINNTWVQTARIFAADGHATPSTTVPGDFISDGFGQSVAISEDANTIVVGAPAHSHLGGPSAGAVYVFQRVNGVWIQEAELRSPVPNNLDSFGNQQGGTNGGGVAISGNVIAVSDTGNPRTFDPFTGTFRVPAGVDVFTRINGTWTLTAQLTVAADPFLTPNSLAFDGTTLVFGSAFSDAPSASSAGVAYVFQLSGGTWSGPTVLSAADATSFAQFGNGVSVSGNSIAVAANAGAGATAFSGAAYVFVNDNGVWRQKAKLFANDGMDFDSFGQSIAINGMTVVVGANNHTAPGAAFGTGAAYAFRPGDAGGWRQIAEVSPSDGIGGGGFGDSIAIRGNTLVVGADQQHPPVEGYAGGEGYVYLISGNP
jgi:FG-GAP repeat